MAETDGALNSEAIPATLRHPRARRFWLAVSLIGVSTGLGAGALTRLLELVQHLAWHGSGANILDAGRQASALRHFIVLVAAGLLTGAGQFLLKRLSSGNGIDTTAAIWFYAGRMPALRTLGSAILSIFVVAMGASMGREGAPNRLARFLPICSPTLRIFPMSNGGSWWLVAREPGWARPTGCPLVVLFSRWK